MRRCVVLLCCFALVLGFAMATMPVDAAGEPTEYQVIEPGSWAAVDGLGRTLSSAVQVGAPKEDKYVGIFYWSWHDYFSYADPRNITQIINQYPEAQNDINHPAWGSNNVLHPYFWDEPLFGYYRTGDTFVLRKQAELLADAGVDFIVFDCSNGTELFRSGYTAVFEAFSQAKKDGVAVPKIAFLLSWYDTNCRLQLRSLYRNIYSKGNYEDLWFRWEGKPLVISHLTALDPKDTTDQEILNTFTFRTMRASYFDPQYAYEDKVWGWCSVYPQTRFGVRPDGSVEMMCVSTAQNANETAMTAMNDPKGGVRGRGYAKGNYSYSYTYGGKQITVDKNRKDAYIYGLNFQQQWDYAMQYDPQVVFMTGWNEYVAQLAEDFLGVPCAFSDNFNAEYSRDIAPSAGILQDHFYYQMVENIRRFKGTAVQTVATEEHGVVKTINIGDGVADWDSVSLSYAHYTNSSAKRDSKGFGDLHYTNNTFRNDFVEAKVAYDRENLYFLVKTKNNITAPSDDGWMRLFIDTDPTGNTPNWEGFEYVINRYAPEGNLISVEKSKGDWDFELTGIGVCSVSGQYLEIAVPRSSLGLDATGVLSFNFKWADHTRPDEATADSGDILDFYQYGDVAPGGRFAFRFTTVEEEVPSNAIPTVLPTPSPSPAKTASEGNLLIWIVIICAAVVLVALGVLGILLYKRRRK